MLSSEDLLAKWNGLRHRGGGYTRIDSVHPLEIYIGHEAVGRKTLLMITAFQPELVESSKSILADVGQRHDGRWALALQLIRVEQEPVFIQLCCDLIESSRMQTDDVTGLRFFISRYRQWLRLMEHQGAGLMDESTRKGLLGELCYLQRRITEGMVARDAVAGWIGPEGADQDFVYIDGWHETKAEGSSSKTVSISSLEQLDAELPGELIVFFVDKTAPDHENGFSLTDKVRETRALMGESAEARELFETKLLRYGYMELKEYGEQRYRVGAMARYRVDEAFPRLIKSNMPTEIAASRYEISLNAISRWKVE